MRIGGSSTFGIIFFQVNPVLEGVDIYHQEKNQEVNAFSFDGSFQDEEIMDFLKKASIVFLEKKYQIEEKEVDVQIIEKNLHIRHKSLGALFSKDEKKEFVDYVKKESFNQKMTPAMISFS